MNNFKTILSVAVLVSMASATQAGDITLTAGNASDSGTVVADSADYAVFSAVNAMTSANLDDATVDVTGVLGDATSSVITLGATAKTFVVSYSATGTSASQSLTQVHDAASTASVVAASALQVSSNVNNGAITADGTMNDMTLTAAAQDSMVFSVAATGAAGSQSITPDLIR